MLIYCIGARNFNGVGLKKCWKAEATWDGRENVGISIKKLGFKFWFYHHLIR